MIPVLFKGQLYILKYNVSLMFFSLMSRMLREIKAFEKRSMLMGGGPQVSVDKRVNGVSCTQLFENLLFALAGLEGKK